MRSLAFVALLFIATPAFAQSSVPTLQPIANIEVTETEYRTPIEKLVARYKRTGRAEVLKQSDEAVYPFGHEQPTMSCTVLRACAIELQEGEQVFYAKPADPRWTSQITRMGPGGRTPVILVQPKYQKTTTNLVITTNKRMYNITLDSPPVDESEQNPQGKYLRRVAFYYPDERLQKQQQAIQQAQARQTQASRQEAFAGVSVNDITLNYRFSKSSDFPWKPKGVFSADGRVYIKIPEGVQEYPMLFEVGPAEELRPMNYPPPSEKGAYITDREFDKAVLMIGVDERKGPLSFMGVGKKKRTKQKLEIIRIDD